MSSQTERPHIVILIDNSGSMNGVQKATAAAFNAMADAVRDFNHCPRLSLGFFNDSTQFAKWYVMADEFPPLLSTDIHPSGGTMLFSAIWKAVTQIQMQKAAPTLILAITDGETSPVGFERMAGAFQKEKTKRPLDLAIVGPCWPDAPPEKGLSCELTLCQLTDAGSQLYMNYQAPSAFRKMADITADALARWVKRASHHPSQLTGRGFFNEFTDEATYVKSDRDGESQRPSVQQGVHAVLGDGSIYWPTWTFAFEARNMDRSANKQPALPVPKLYPGKPCPYTHGLYTP